MIRVNKILPFQPFHRLFRYIKKECSAKDLIMSKKSLFLTIFSIMLILQACVKDELTMPAKVFLDFELIPYQEGNSLKSGPPFETPVAGMIIDQGNITIESIIFDGKRDEGKDVYFVSNFASPVLVNLENGHVDSDLSFDIPQGVYNRIELSLTLGGNNEIPLLLKGRMKKGPLDNKMPLRFEYIFNEQIKIVAEPAGKANKIVLRRDNPANAKIVVDAGVLFQFIGFPELNDVNTSEFNDEEMVIISAESNIDLFRSMVMQSRGLEKAFRVIFD